LSSNKKGQGPHVTASGDEATKSIIRSINTNNQTSTRRLSKETGISRSTVGRIIKSCGIKKWKPKVRQMLYDGDKDRRMVFCEKMVAFINRDGSFLSNLIFTDEAVFHVSGHVNHHNCYYYSEDDPNIIWGKPVNSPSLCIWAAIGRRGVVLFQIQRETMNGDRYLALCQEKIIPYFRRSNTKILIQDGAPCHYDNRVRALLDENLPQRWIGRRGSLCDFPPRSPDLTASDYFFWGVLREFVNKDGPVLNLQELEVRITNSIDNIPRVMFEKSIIGFEKRCKKCLDLNGSVFE
jgi:hypothetical protein